jgi:hypothetical protein
MIDSTSSEAKIDIYEVLGFFIYSLVAMGPSWQALASRSGYKRHQ